MGGLVAALALVLPAQASAAFQALGNVSPSAVDVAFPEVAAAANGDSAAVWQRGDGLHDRAEFSFRRAGGNWRSIGYISSADEDIADPHVALSSNGDATFVWVRTDGADPVVEGRTVSASGERGPLLRLSALGEEAGDPAVAVGSGGAAVFCWRRSDGANERIQARFLSAAGVLGRVVTLSPAGGDAAAPGLGVDAEGNAVLVWQRTAGGHTRVEARRLEADGGVGPTLFLSPADTDSDSPDVALGPDGTAAVVWAEARGSGRQARIRTLSPSGDLTTSQRVSAGGREIMDPHVAVDGAGTAVVIWERHEQDGHWRLQATLRDADGTVHDRRGISPAGADAAGGQVGVSSSGLALFAWRRFVNGHWLFESRERGPGGTLTSVRTSSLTTQDALDPRLAMSSAGNAVLAWRRVGGPDGFGLGALVRSSAGAYSAVGVLFSGFRDANKVSVATNPSGDSLFSWLRATPSGWYLEARRRSAAGVLGPTVAVAFVEPLVSSPYAEPGHPDVARAHYAITLDPAGNAFFAWEGQPGYRGVLISSWPAGGVPSPPQTLWPNATSPVAAVDGSGTVTIVAVDGPVSAPRLAMATRSAAGDLSETAYLSQAGERPERPQVAVGPTGATAFSWAWGDTQIRARLRTASGTLTPEVSINGGSPLDQRDSRLAVGAAGDALVTWAALASGYVRRLGADGTLGPTYQLYNGNANANVPKMALLPNGDAVFIWSRGGAPKWITTRALSAGGTLGSVTDLTSHDDYAGGQDLVATSDGRVVYAWNLDIASPPSSGLQSRVRATDGTIGPVDHVADYSWPEPPALSADAHGRVVMAWRPTYGQTAPVMAAVGP